MGLILAAVNAATGVMRDQWKEFFYCDAIDEHVLMTRGHRKTSGSLFGNKGDDNIISNGSVIAVADGQCMLIVEQGKVVELCAEPGEYRWDSSTEPSIFSGNLGDSVKQTFQAIGRRFTYGGATGKDQRVYYINTKELVGNKYGTASPVPFRVVDNNIGLDVDISVRCFGEYSYRIVDPILFYTNVAANVPEQYDRDQIDSQLRTELLTALQPAFAKISAMGIRYSAVPGHTTELAQALNEELSEKWRKLRGIEIVSLGISSLTASEEDEARIKELQMSAALRNPNMAAASLAAAQAQAMRDAAKNTSAGPSMAFMGMNMAAQAGGANAASLFAMGNGQAQPGAYQNAYPSAANGGFAAAQQQAASQAAGAGYPGAGQPQAAGAAAGMAGAAAPAAGAAHAPGEWFCPSCGAKNTGKFCTECGTKKPEAPAVIKCPGCGKEYPAASVPKFCPDCGTKLS